MKQRLIEISIAFAPIMPVLQIIKIFHKYLDNSEQSLIGLEKQWEIAKMVKDKANKI